jgi:peptide/nickel transport system permease protein
MASYLANRLFWAIPIMFGVSLITFIVMRMLPGDYAVVMLGVEASQDPQTLANVRRSLGLDQPLPVQYLNWLGRVVQGDLGTSLAQKVSVRDEILRRLPVTIELAVLASLVSVVLGVPLGLLSALRGGFWDWSVRGFNVLGIAVPNFFVGTIFILLGALYLPWLTTFEYVALTVDPVGNLRAMLYPSLALGLGMAAVIAENTRSAALDVANREYIMVARAKGLTARLVTLRHLLRNALIPVITVFGLQIGTLLGGTIIIESIFALPGLGRLAYSAVNLRDYPVIQGCVLVVAAKVVLANLATDIAYAFADPRIRRE